MGFVFHSIPSLPRLSWCAILERGSAAAVVYHGVDVDVEDAGFLEGVHDGAAGAAGAVDAVFTLATGGYFDGRRYVFFTPGHTLDCIYTARSSDRLFLSNSLPFVMSAARTGLDWDYIHYRADFESNEPGCKQIPSSGSQSIGVYTCTNLVVNSELVISVEEKNAPASFETYSEYLHGIRACLAKISKDAGRSDRKVQYEPFATVSSGYDSPATAIFARDIGATHSVTISNSRQGGLDAGSDDDSGEEIARLLGLAVEAIDRLDYRRYGIEAERLFYFRAEPEDIVFYPFKDVFSGKLLFTGIHGDTMWNCWAAPSGARRRDNVGCSMQEFRLRSGFIQAPMPFYGWQHHENVIAIGRSEEMKPWRLDSDYDRPIARRLIEEAGVPRETFGQQKRAVTVVPTTEKADAVVSEQVRNALSGAFREDVCLRTRASIVVANLAHFGYVASVSTIKNVLAVLSRKELRESLRSSRVTGKSRKFSKRFGIFTFAAQWATDELKSDYGIDAKGQAVRKAGYGAPESTP